MQGLTAKDGRLRMLAAAASELAAVTGAAGEVADVESMELRAGRWSCSQGHQADGEIGSKAVLELAKLASWLSQDMQLPLWRPTTLPNP